MLKASSAEELFPADAAHMRGSYHQVRSNFFQRDRLQDVGASIQQLEVAFFGREAVKVQVTRIGLQEKLFSVDAGDAGLLAVKGGKLFGWTNIDFTSGQGLYVSFRTHAIDARRIVGDKLAGKGKARVVLAVFGFIDADVFKDSRFDKAKIRINISFSNQVLAFPESTQFSVPDAQFFKGIGIYLLDIWIEIAHILSFLFCEYTEDQGVRQTYPPLFNGITGTQHP